MGRMGLCIAAGMVLLASAVADAAQAPALRLELSTAPGCLRSEEVKASLEAQLHEAGGTVRVEALNPTQLLLTLVDDTGRVLGRRALDFESADCAALPQTVVLMVEAWLSNPPEAPLPPIGPAPVEQGGARPPRRVARPAPEPPADACRPAEPPVEASPPVAPPPPAPICTPVPAEAPTLAHHLSLSAMGGAFLMGSGAHAGGQGGGGLTWRIGETWGTSLLVFFDQTLAATSAQATAEANLISFDLSAELRLHLVASGALLVSLGLSLQRLGMTARAFETTTAAVLYDFGGVASLAWEQRVAGNLSIVLGVRANLQGHSEDVVAHGPDGDGTVLSISPLRLAASVGLAWQFF